MPFLGAGPKTVWGTPEFMRWFAGSVIRNPDGTPRVMYHGTIAIDEFTVFQPRSDQLGVHFGTLCQVDEFTTGAMDYETAYSKDRAILKRYRPRSIPVYLAIKNPLRLEDPNHWSAGNVAKQLFNRGVITAKDKHTIDAIDAGYDNEKRRTVPWQQQNADIKAVSALIERAGYDGIVYFNETESTCFDPDTDERIHEDSYIILRPTQVKSAIGNKGDFSSTNPDILHGLLRSPARRGR